MQSYVSFVSMNLKHYFLLLLLVLLVAAPAKGQQMTPDKIAELIARDTCVDLEMSKVKVCKADYQMNGNSIEAISFQPAGKGPFPGVLMIPGYQRTAVNLISLGIALGREGLAGLAVTQPGFGKSQGQADYVGPNTLKVLEEGFLKLKREPYVDRKRMGHLRFQKSPRRSKA
jgi:hypothetical protein